MTREECDELRAELEKKIEVRIHERVGAGVAGAEARLKIWFLVGLVTVVALILTFVVNLGSYRERVDQNVRRLDRVERQIDRTDSPDRERRVP